MRDWWICCSDDDLERKRCSDTQGWRLKPSYPPCQSIWSRSSGRAFNKCVLTLTCDLRWVRGSLSTCVLKRYANQEQMCSLLVTQPLLAFPLVLTRQPHRRLLRTLGFAFVFTWLPFYRWGMELSKASSKDEHCRPNQAAGAWCTMPQCLSEAAECRHSTALRQLVNVLAKGNNKRTGQGASCLASKDGGANQNITKRIELKTVCTVTSPITS